MNHKLPRIYQSLPRKTTILKNYAEILSSVKSIHGMRGKMRRRKLEGKHFVVTMLIGLPRV